MHQVSLETICLKKPFQLHYCPHNDAKSMVKRFIFLHKFSVLTSTSSHVGHYIQNGFNSTLKFHYTQYSLIDLFCVCRLELFTNW